MAPEADGICLIADLELPGIVTRALRGPTPRRALYAIAPEQSAHPHAGALTDELQASFSRRRSATRRASRPGR
jgi:hypothetical protein